ncbi:hypothetical protein B0H12DRAFT_1073054 [Mycena haematopus]|nr:hypothetical protein B0H12DRAFT_1073054 [Mycena haematopus]
MTGCTVGWKAALEQSDAPAGGIIKVHLERHKAAAPNNPLPESGHATRTYPIDYSDIIDILHRCREDTDTPELKSLHIMINKTGIRAIHLQQSFVVSFRPDWISRLACTTKSYGPRTEY